MEGSLIGTQLYKLGEIACEVTLNCVIGWILQTKLRHQANVLLFKISVESCK